MGRDEVAAFPARLRDDLLSAVALLTRVPVPDHLPSGARAAWAWPLVGAAVGGVAGLAGLAAGGAGPGAAVALAVQAVLTGAMHEDGLADTADGFWGGRTRERRLEIMKDSRIGSYGVLALVLVTLTAWSALGAGTVAALVAAGAVSRAPMAGLMAALPNARDGGLSRHVGRPAWSVAGLGVGVALGLGGLAVGWAVLAMAAAAAAVSLAVGLVARARIGGQTGDVLGAAQQLSFAAGLAVLAA